MVRSKLPHVGVMIAGAALTAVLAGCGNGGQDAALDSASSATPSPTPSTSSPEVPAPGTGPGAGNPSAGVPAPRPDNGLCKAADLQLSLGHGDAAAGTAYKPLRFTNISDHPCTIQGFPGVSYVAGTDGHQVGAPAYRDGAKGAAIKLNKGETASADIGFVNVQNYDGTTCQPQPVRGLRVYPPQETEAKFVEYQGTGCANDKLPGNQLTVKTIHPGGGA
jgi:hypothetical protein